MQSTACSKGAIERWHRTWREEVGDELPEQPLPLSELNAYHWAWLAAEYHLRKHDTTGRAPRDHFLDERLHVRPIPRSLNIHDVFLHRARRTVRKDGTVRWRGRYLEVRAELLGQEVELRFDPHDPDTRPRAFVEGRFVCDTVPLDLHFNATRRRRRLVGAPDAVVEAPPDGLEPLDLIRRDHYEHTRPIGVSPLPTDTHRKED